MLTREGGGGLLERRRLFDEIWYLNLNGSLKALTACGEKKNLM